MNNVIFLDTTVKNVQENRGSLEETVNALGNIFHKCKVGICSKPIKEFIIGLPLVSSNGVRAE